jgi:hypothetical protein
MDADGQPLILSRPDPAHRARAVVLVSLSTLVVNSLDAAHVLRRITSNSSRH